jgi:23S rRNA (guanosine2251-2'-O)-methyltransferase
VGKEYKQDSEEYLKKKAYFKQFLTIYGRKAVLEALESGDGEVAKIHLAKKAKGGIVNRIRDLAEKNNIEINETTAEAVTRISKNGRQDQGIAADIKMPGFYEARDFFDGSRTAYSVIALDGVTTPANVGMIIRSCTAGGMDGIAIPERECCSINPMVIKASAGTIFKSSIIRADRIKIIIDAALADGAEIISMDVKSKSNLFEFSFPEKSVFVFGSESNGVSRYVSDKSTQKLYIPMSNGVESLNVAVSSALVSYKINLTKK